MTAALCGLLLCVAFALSCGQRTTSACTPGQSIACVGPSGCSGGQACVANGSGYAPCDCGADGQDGGPSGGVDAGSPAIDAGEPDAGTDAGEADAGSEAGFGDAGADGGPPDGGLSCSAGLHNGGDGGCVAAGTCLPGFHDGGDGRCVPTGTCAANFHDGGDGVCAAASECSVGYRNGGEGVCVVLGTCSSGYHDSCGVGVCHRTLSDCISDSNTTTCVPGTPSAEVCNGMDDDCDGVVDNGSLSCGIGACARTVAACMNSTNNVCLAGTPTTEVCNGLDDDCDGTAEQGKWLSDLLRAGTTFQVPINCSKATFQVIGEVAIADQGGAGCTTETCGRMDGVCDNKDAPAWVPVTVTAVNQVPRPPDRVDLSVTLAIETTRIYADTVSRIPATCSASTGVKCSMRFNSASTGSPTNLVVLEIQPTRHATRSHLVDLPLKGSRGLEVCGTSGAQPSPKCLDVMDVATNSENTCGGTYSSAADWDPVRDYLLQILSPTVLTQLSQIITGDVCQPCGTGWLACP